MAEQEILNLNFNKGNRDDMEIYDYLKSLGRYRSKIIKALIKNLMDNYGDIDADLLYRLIPISNINIGNSMNRTVRVHTVTDKKKKKSSSKGFGAKKEKPVEIPEESKVDINKFEVGNSVHTEEKVEDSEEDIAFALSALGNLTSVEI